MTKARLKNIAINTGLAFLAGFATSFAAFMAFTDHTDLPAVKAFVLAAVWAGARGAYGVISAEIKAIPQVPTDR